MICRCLAGVAMVLGVAGEASARRGGIVARGCEPCHGTEATSAITATTDPAVLMPGQNVMLNVSIRRSGAAVGGVFVADPGVGHLTAIAGQGLVANSSGLTHSSPRPAQSGQVDFRLMWQAPGTPGSTRVEIFGLAANGDGTPDGDAPGRLVFPLVYGCDPQEFYFDADGDGHGASAFPPTTGCAGTPPIGYAATEDDCDDGHDAVHPGAAETCNGRDDDCDGRIDEDASPVDLWPDEDGDGYYAAQTGVKVQGCAPLSGYAAESGDCAPSDSARHPGAVEICNQLDDNCDGKVDEGVRPQCGVGLCRRASVSCLLEDCVPGFPSPEVCDLLDNDCDGVVDEEASCSGGGASIGSGRSGGGSSGVQPNPSGGMPTSLGGQSSMADAGQSGSAPSSCSFSRQFGHSVGLSEVLVLCAGAFLLRRRHSLSARCNSRRESIDLE